MNIKQESNISGSSKPKYFQRFCEKWLSIFHPWLSRCADDPNKPFCRACQCRLDCNRCHLQRHARTSKHARNLEILVSKGESAARENLSLRQERSKYYQQRKKISELQDLESAIDSTEDYIEDDEVDGDGNFQFVQTDAASNDQFSDETSMKQEIITPHGNNFNSRKCKDYHKHKRGPQRKDRNELLMQIQEDKRDIMDSFKELIGSRTELSHTPHKEHNHVDLFFESVSSSVKALTPKLIAEAKMRVSQLICELELRALTEADGGGNKTNAALPVEVSPHTENAYIVNQHQTHHIQEESRQSNFETLS